MSTEVSLVKCAKSQHVLIQAYSVQGNMYYITECSGDLLRLVGLLVSQVSTSVDLWAYTLCTLTSPPLREYGCYCCDNMAL